MKKMYLLMGVLCACLGSVAQTPYCITPPVQSKYYEKLKESVPLVENYSAFRKSGTLRNVSLILI